MSRPSAPRHENSWFSGMPRTWMRAPKGGIVVKQVLWICFFVCLSAGIGNAASISRISLYADAASTECTLADIESRLAEVFVVHHVGALAGNSVVIRFQLSASTGFTGSWVQDAVSAGMFAIGTSPDGVQIHYQACRTGDVAILRVTYQLSGTSSPCSFLPVEPYPGDDLIEPMDCSFTSHSPVGGNLFVNPNESCPCEEPVPVQATTWGRVKALYR
jgi:hypothetical protein